MFPGCQVVSVRRLRGNQIFVAAVPSRVVSLIARWSNFWTDHCWLWTGARLRLLRTWCVKVVTQSVETRPWRVFSSLDRRVFVAG